MIRPPARRPCASCPYRRDVPSGVWHPSEYAKLPGYDRPTGDQPPGLFMCHQQTGRLCAGWVAVHDMAESFGLRLAVALGGLSLDLARALEEYTTDVPLFATGAEAAAHGLREVAHVGDRARAAQARIRRKRERAQ